MIWNYVETSEETGKSAIIWNYIETSGETGKSAIIWNYIETPKACKSACSVSEFGRARNYTPDNNGKTTWGYREL